MEVRIGAVVYDKRFPDTVIGKAVYINSKTQVAIVETQRGWSVLPTYMIASNGGNYAR